MKLDAIKVDPRVIGLQIDRILKFFDCKIILAETGQRGSFAVVSNAWSCTRYENSSLERCTNFKA